VKKEKKVVFMGHSTPHTKYWTSGISSVSEICNFSIFGLQVNISISHRLYVYLLGNLERKKRTSEKAKKISMVDI
jgi:hypothetical protein